MTDSIEDARAVLAAHAFLHDDPDAYLAGVEDALRLVLTDAERPGEPAEGHRTAEMPG
jgi:hypothetical protein